MHQFKYKGNKDLGLQLGRLMGNALKNAARFNEIEALVPFRFFRPKKKREAITRQLFFVKEWQKFYQSRFR